MSDSKKPTLSEIVWRNAVGIKSLRNDKGTIGGEGALAISEGVQYDTPYLLDLVARMRQVFSPLVNNYATLCDQCIITVESDGSITHEDMCTVPEARVLLEELKQ